MVVRPARAQPSRDLLLGEMLLRRRAAMEASVFGFPGGGVRCVCARRCSGVLGLGGDGPSTFASLCACGRRRGGNLSLR